MHAKVQALVAMVLQNHLHRKADCFPLLRCFTSLSGVGNGKQAGQSKAEKHAAGSGKQQYSEAESTKVPHKYVFCYSLINSFLLQLSAWRQSIAQVVPCARDGRG